MLGADRILDNIMMYWIPAAATSAARLYWESVRDLRTGGVSVPMGVSVFQLPVPFLAPVCSATIFRRSLLGEPAVGSGHFAAF